MRTDPNIEALRNVALKADPETGIIQNSGQFTNYLYKAFKALTKQVGNIGSQTNSALNASESAAPPAVDKLLVTASGGVVHLQAVHNVDLYRGATYHYHVSGDGGSTWSTLYSGPNRDVRLPMGSGAYQYAVTCDYPTSPASPATYYTAGGVNPASVAASGSEPPPLPSGQGSGTGTPGQIAGYGPVAWRGTNQPRRS